MKVKDIPKRVSKQIRYIRGEGYKIVYSDGSLSPETYYSQCGAAMMILGKFNSRAFQASI